MKFTVLDAKQDKNSSKSPDTEPLRVGDNVKSSCGADLKSQPSAGTEDKKQARSVLTKLDLSELSEEQKEVASRMFEEEMDSFSGNVKRHWLCPSLKLDIHLTDKQPVQKKLCLGATFSLWRGETPHRRFTEQGIYQTLKVIILLTMCHC